MTCRKRWWKRSPTSLRFTWGHHCRLTAGHVGGCVCGCGDKERAL